MMTSRGEGGGHPKRQQRRQKMNNIPPLTRRQFLRTSAALATLSDDGPTGGYFHLGKPLPW